MLSKCRFCGSEAIATHTLWAGHRIECTAECSFTYGHEIQQEAINEWESVHGVANNNFDTDKQ